MSKNRIDRTDADCVVCLLRHLKAAVSLDSIHGREEETRQSEDLFNFLIDFLCGRADSENCLALWKLGEELLSEKLVASAVGIVQVKVETGPSC